MDQKYLMGSRDWLLRASNEDLSRTCVWPGLQKDLTAAAIKAAYRFYTEFFDVTIGNIDFHSLADDYQNECLHALSLGLFESGGIQQRDHLNFWCLRNVFRPTLYVESGVFIGSSLHAFINSPGIKKIVCIDPDLSALKIDHVDIPGAVLIDNQDFCELVLDVSEERAFAYFDDHIDTARRIREAHEKGFNFLLFDDSTGFEGLCQRLYPAVPTIPMILNVESLRPGESISWTFNRNTSGRLMRIARAMLNRRSPPKPVRITMQITSELIAACQSAKSLIAKCRAVPSLAEFIPQAFPGPSVDTTKYLLQLR